MDHPLFEITPFGDKWAVTAHEEVLMVTRTKREARKLVRDAERVLASSFEEPRSFAPQED